MDIEYQIKGITLNSGDLSIIHDFYAAALVAEYLLENNPQITSREQALELGYEVRHQMDKYDFSESEAVEEVLKKAGLDLYEEEDDKNGCVYKIVDRFDNDTELFFTVEVATGFYVDVKVLPQNGLVYVMENGDGSTVFSNGDRVRELTWPNFEYDKAMVIQMVSAAVKKEDETNE